MWGIIRCFAFFLIHNIVLLHLVPVIFFLDLVSNRSGKT